MDNKTVTIKINGVEYAVDGGSTILEACRKAGIEIPFPQMDVHLKTKD